MTRAVSKCVAQTVGAIGWDEDFTAKRGDDDGFFVGGIDGREFVNAHAHNAGCGADVDVAGDGDGFVAEFVFNPRQGDAILGGVVDDVFNRLQLGHVLTGFQRHSDFGISA